MNQVIRQALQIGLMWLGMTIAFEFGFGLDVIGHAWVTLLHDYNILEGRMWTVVLIATLIGPAIVFQYQQRFVAAPA